MIDLKSLAGSKYRIALDESSKIDTCREHRNWYYRIPCKYGFISAHGGDVLAGFATGRIMARKLAGVPDVTVHQRGDQETRILFSADRLDEVAALLRARRRRQVSEAQREAARVRFAEYKLGQGATEVLPCPTSCPAGAGNPTDSGFPDPGTGPG